MAKHKEGSTVPIPYLQGALARPFCQTLGDLCSSLKKRAASPSPCPFGAELPHYALLAPAAVAPGGPRALRQLPGACSTASAGCLRATKHSWLATKHRNTGALEQHLRIIWEAAVHKFKGPDFQLNDSLLIIPQRHCFKGVGRLRDCLR
eukprot:1161447-Pelagomonas_calceolata.AAC.5